MAPSLNRNKENSVATTYQPNVLLKAKANITALPNNKQDNKIQNKPRNIRMINVL